MITGQLEATIIAHLRTRRDKKSRDLAEQLYAKNHQLHPTCRYCTHAKNSYMDNHVYCPKRHGAISMDAQRICFQGVESFNTRTAPLRAKP